MADISETLRLHSLWLKSAPEGVHADLRSADLRSADLRSADLRSANLRSANLFRADLSAADLSGADLHGADLFRADLHGADLREGLKAGRWVGSATRGDGYLFHMFETDAGEPFIFAGCRALLRSEYDAHIEREYPGTDKAAATRACLDYLAALKPL